MISQISLPLQKHYRQQHFFFDSQTLFDIDQPPCCLFPLFEFLLEQLRVAHFLLLSHNLVDEVILVPFAERGEEQVGALNLASSGQVPI